MNASALNYRNTDLIPEILNAMAHHKAGNAEQMQIQICNINHKLMERGDEPDEFWAGWAELCRVYASR